MRLTDTEQDILRASLENTVKAFFRQRAKNKSKLIVAGPKAPAQVDRTQVLVVLSQWVGDMIREAPEAMKDDLFMAFADNAAEQAGIKEQAQEEEAA